MKKEVKVLIFIAIISIGWIGYTVTEGDGHKYWNHLREQTRQADIEFEKTYGEPDSLYEYEFIDSNPEPSHFCKWYYTDKQEP